MNVWYAAYGSNLYSTRLGFYLRGGRPPGASRTYPGCRDPAPPVADMAVWLPGGVFFALESPAWGGGMAFYDPSLSGFAAARAYLLTVEQFSDIAAQEMYREPGGLVDVAEVVESGRVELGDGRYETLVCPGSIDGVPLVTFTCPWSADQMEWRPPSPAYLSMIAGGLMEAHGWHVGEVVDYLSELRGIAGAWSREALLRVVGMAAAA